MGAPSISATRAAVGTCTLLAVSAFRMCLADAFLFLVRHDPELFSQIWIVHRRASADLICLATSLLSVLLCLMFLCLRRLGLLMSKRASICSLQVCRVLTIDVWGSV